MHDRPYQGYTSWLDKLLCGLAGHVVEVWINEDKKGKNCGVMCSRCFRKQYVPFSETTYDGSKIKKIVMYKVGPKDSAYVGEPVVQTFG